MTTRDQGADAEPIDQPEAADLNWRIVRQRIWRALRPFSSLAAGTIVLSSCALGPAGQFLTQAQVEERIPLHQVPVAQAWINAPEAQLVLQRELGFGSEQRISLQNRTLVPEDNLIVLRTRSGISAGRSLRFEEFMRRVGEIPFPFGNVTSGELISASDELGSYLWTEEQIGAGTVCVFGIRRLNSSMRQIPAGDAAMDVMLRNCVVGTADEALQPLLAASVGSPSIAQTGTDQSRLISPLAGPTLP